MSLGLASPQAPLRHLSGWAELGAIAAPKLKRQIQEVIVVAARRHKQSKAVSSKASAPIGQAGFSLVEALVASFLLMLAVSQSLNIFGVTMNALGASRIRDGLNTAIHADLESVRNEVSTWKLDTSIDGMTAYNLSGYEEACKTNTLATELLDEKREASKLPATLQSISLGNSSIPPQGSSVSRTINVFSRTDSGSGDGNLIEVSYNTNSGSVVAIERRAVISIPAQGWCVYD